MENNEPIILKKSPDLLVILPFVYEAGFVFFLVCFGKIVSFEKVSLVEVLSVLLPLLPIILLVLIILLLCIDVQCWNFNGKEILSFYDDYLLVSQKGRILKNNRRINYKDIVYIEFEKYPRGPLGIDVFYTHGWKGGCVKITKKNGDSYYFGQSLTAPEAKRQVIPEIKERIFERSGLRF